MKHKTRIIPQDGKFVGYALMNDEVVFTSGIHSDAALVAKELSDFVSSTNPSLAPKTTYRPFTTSNQTPVNNLVPVNRNVVAPVNVPIPEAVAPAIVKKPLNLTPPNPSTRKCCGRG